VTNSVAEYQVTENEDFAHVFTVQNDDNESLPVKKTRQREEDDPAPAKRQKLGSGSHSFAMPSGSRG